MKAPDGRYRAEYLAARLGIDLFRWLPLPAAVALAHRMADAAFALDRRRRRTAIENIQLAGLDANHASARVLARQSFRHFAAMLVETLHAEKLLNVKSREQQLTWRVDPETEALINDPDRQFIMASGHLGNWEIGAQALARRKPVTAVARPLNNPYLARYLHRINPRQGVRQIPKYGNDPLRLLKLLQAGNVLGMMIDQHARQQSVWLDFFGRPAASYTAVALLPLILRIPLCFGQCIRTGPGQFELTISEPLPVKRSGNRAADVSRILTDLNCRLETAIRVHPEQYLWAHRRWRQPPTAPA